MTCVWDPDWHPSSEPDRLPSIVQVLAAILDRRGAQLVPRGRGQCVRSANAALTSALACKAPSTVTEAMDARANSAVTS